MIGILLITSIEGLFMQGMAAGVLVNILFGIPISIGMLCFFLLCVIYVGFGGMVLIQRLAFVQVILMFAAAILIPLYFFLAKGVENVYQGIRLYHPYLLVLNNHEGLFYVHRPINWLRANFRRPSNVAASVYDRRQENRANLPAFWAHLGNRSASLFFVDHGRHIYRQF